MQVNSETGLLWLAAHVLFSSHLISLNRFEVDLPEGRQFFKLVLAFLLTNSLYVWSFL